MQPFWKHQPLHEAWATLRIWYLILVSSPLCSLNWPTLLAPFHLCEKAQLFPLLGLCTVTLTAQSII